MTPKILEAVSFGARAHAGQTRKDGVTPYFSHPMRVAMIVAGWGVEDEDVLIAALLHDTIEDTTTDYDDISERFGARAANMVAALTKDSRLAEHERDHLYYRNLEGMGDGTRLIKLADSFDNLTDSSSSKVPVKALEKAKKALALLSRGDWAPMVLARASLAELITLKTPA